MEFTSFQYALVLGAFILQFAVFMASKRFTALRALMAFCMMRDFLSVALRHHPRLYWLIAAGGLQVIWGWWAWIAGHMLFAGRWARVPVFGATVIAAFCPVLTASPAQIYFAQSAVYLLCLCTVGVGFIADLVQEREKAALALAVVFLLLGGASYLAYRGWPGNVTTIVWAGSLGILLVAGRGYGRPAQLDMLAR